MVFRIPSRIVRLLLSRAGIMRCFFSVSDPPAPVRYFVLYRRISEIQLISSERAASLLRECRLLFNMLLLRHGAISLNFLTFMT